MYYVSRNPLDPDTLVHGYGRTARSPDFILAATALAKGAQAVEIVLFSDWVDALRHNCQRTMPSPTIEAVFEEVRQQAFADRPSRLGAKFLWRDIDSVRKFLMQFRNGQGYAYECTVESPYFVTDMQWVNPGIDLKNNIEIELQRMRERAENYWCGNMTDDPWPEIITHSEVKVVRRIDLR